MTHRRDVPLPAEALDTLSVLRHCLGDWLTAVYLHGSAVGGNLRPSSDVDIMAIVDRPTTAEARRQLVMEMLRISGPHRAGGKRSIELIVLLQGDLTPPPYPARSEFLYGEWLREEFETGVVPTPAAKPDHTLILAQARQRATVISGPPPADLLPVILEADIRRAMHGALPALLADLVGDERNVLLTLSRMWHTMETGKFVPKDEAAEWAMQRLPFESAGVLALARDGYLGSTNDDWNARRHDAQRVAGELRRHILGEAAPHG